MNLFSKVVGPNYEQSIQNDLLLGSAKSNWLSMAIKNLLIAYSNATLNSEYMQPRN